jgi:hypothetical protein
LAISDLKKKKKNLLYYQLKIILARGRWLTPVILATREAEIQRIMV